LSENCALYKQNKKKLIKKSGITSLNWVILTFG